MASIFTPIAPKKATVGASAASFGALVGTGNFTLLSTCDAFYLIGGTAEVDGAKCHFLPANQPYDLYAPTGSVVSIIANTGGTGVAYMTEWA